MKAPLPAGEGLSEDTKKQRTLNARRFVAPSSALRAPSPVGEKAETLLAVHLQHGEEGLLGDFHPPDLLHPLLAFFLFL